ncbi:DUF92 domain-containing protein [Halostella sp. PRR32]|uniref:DUF92 domain-containing protein n=1 Tax=Halostella sp. PRR32 TaxID=3098147 RepID=UPI002B1D02BE|nr:DUF92 domain-containing protein [Halostella sp. PRR32]
MTSTVRRAGAFAGVGSLALVAPLLGWAAAVPFAVVAGIAVLVDDGPVFELFARPGDWEEGRLHGLIGFALAATGLGLLSTVEAMPTLAFVGAVLTLVYGNLAAQVVRRRSTDPVVGAVGFVLGGAVGCWIGILATALLNGDSGVAPAFVVFLSASGALLGALLRSVLFERDDPVVVLSVGLLLWFLWELTDPGTVHDVGIALAVTVAVGYASYALDTASVSGMLSGVFLGLLTIVLGGIGWFAVIIVFFGIGGLSTKFRYEEKAQRGVAEKNEGARGSSNVFSNAAVALAAVLAYAAAPIHLPVGDGTGIAGGIFLYAFAGSISTAMSDTLSSEIGGVFDRPRLITTLKPVDPGTDGAVTWQGELAGTAGATLIALVAVALLDSVGPTGAGVILVAGVAGMTVDSLLGATVEGGRLGNQSVNFLATLSGGAVGAVLASGLGIAAVA